MDPAEEPPRDYIVTVTEDLHQNGIVAEVVLSDIFSVGPPFTVTILRGIDLLQAVVVVLYTVK